MQKASYFVGIDISSKYFTVSIIKNPDNIITQGIDLSNDISGFKELEELLEEYSISNNEAAICMECTGVYSEKICYYLYQNEYKVYSEQPNKVKKAFDANSHKTDSVDSRQIAEYMYRFEDKAQLWEPREDVLEEIKTLLNARELLVKHKTAATNHLHAIKKKEVLSETAIDTLEENVKELEEKIDKMENKMNSLVKKKPEINEYHQILKTCPGTGSLLSFRVLVKTNGFKKDVGYKDLSSHIGICPFKNQSGTSWDKKAKSRGSGNAAIRKLLRLAARSVKTHNEKFRKYYLRKREEGKPKPLVLNNIGNKLLKILFAMARDKKEYIPNHKSVNPAIT